MKLRKSCAVALLLILFSTGTTPAFAIKGDTQRFEVCQQLKSTGNINWLGIASGTIDSTFTFHDAPAPFHTKACFATERGCKTWVKRIWWEIPTMDELRTAYCQRQ